ALRPLAFGDGPQADPALTALFIVWGALARMESRGGHYRTDHPAHATEARSSRLTLTDLQAEPIAAAA
ncbi:MAG: hypothetical protein WA840_14290, partial [Caulobacteraceae bacterium]